jgi:hypothetical protein
MRRLILIVTVLTLGLMTGSVFAQAQQTSKTPSLGELARKLRAERGQKAPEAAKVYTNDNIPRTGALSDVGPTAQPAASSTPAKNGSTATTGESADNGAGKSASGTHDEKYYREKMKELQSQKAMHERELAVLNQKLSLNQTQYYTDPNKTLTQEYTREDITKKQDEIDKKKQQIANDEKALEDLQAQCQQEGCPAGWLR